MCPLPHRQGDCQVVAGLAVCEGHRRGFEQLLVDVRELWGLLGDVELPGPSSDQHVRGKAVAPAAPVRLDVLVCRDVRDEGSAVAVVRRWWVFVQRERRGGGRWVGVEGGVSGLMTHLVWLLGRGDVVVDLWGDLRGVVRVLREAVGDVGPPSVGACPVLVDRDGEQVECGSRLFKQSVGYGVRCSGCGASWLEDELRRLGLLLASQT